MSNGYKMGYLLGTGLTSPCIFGGASSRRTVFGFSEIEGDVAPSTTDDATVVSEPAERLAGDRVPLTDGCIESVESGSSRVGGSRSGAPSIFGLV